MKRKGTKIHCIFVAIPGLALHYPVTPPHFTYRQRGQMMLIRVDIVVKISLVLASRHPLQGPKWLLQQSKIGNCE